MPLRRDAVETHSVFRRELGVLLGFLSTSVVGAMGDSPELGLRPGETKEQYIIRLEACLRRPSTSSIDQATTSITNGSGNQDPGPQADK